MIVNVVKLVEATKAKAAAASVFLPGLTTMLVHWGTTGEFNAVELRILAASTGAAILTGLTTFLANSGPAVVDEKEVELDEDDDEEVVIQESMPDAVSGFQGPGDPDEVKP